VAPDRGAQSYLRVAKRAVIMVGPLYHAHQFKRPDRVLKFLRTRLGRLIRDINRKVAGDPHQRGFEVQPVFRTGTG
jgi:hypothetical protein